MLGAERARPRALFAAKICGNARRTKTESRHASFCVEMVFLMRVNSVISSASLTQEWQNLVIWTWTRIGTQIPKLTGKSTLPALSTARSRQASHAHSSTRTACCVLRTATMGCLMDHLTRQLLRLRDRGLLPRSVTLVESQAVTACANKSLDTFASTRWSIWVSRKEAASELSVALMSITSRQRRSLNCFSSCQWTSTCTVTIRSHATRSKARTGSCAWLRATTTLQSQFHSRSLTTRSQNLTTRPCWSRTSREAWSQWRKCLKRVSYGADSVTRSAPCSSWTKTQAR